MSGLMAQPVLQWRERTPEAQELDQDPPTDRRQVDPNDPLEAHGQEAAEHHERHEQEVDEDDQIGEHGVPHWCCSDMS